MELEEKALKDTKSVFPFKTRFSLRPLIDKYWLNTGNEDSALRSGLKQMVREELEKAPELLEPISDISVVEKHRQLVDTLFSAVIPPATYGQTIMAATNPFQLEPVFITPRFKELDIFSDGRMNDNLNLKNMYLNTSREMFAYLAVLDKYFGINIHYEYPLIYHFTDPVNGLDRYYRVRIFSWFIDIKVIREHRPLSETDKNRIIDNLNDIGVWREIIDPGCFEFQGFLLFDAIDVTKQEIISSMKYDLIDTDSITSVEKFNSLEKKLRSLLRKPDLLMGVIALKSENDQRLNYGRRLGRSFVLNDSCIECCKVTTKSVYEKLLAGAMTVVIRDLTQADYCTPIEKAIIEQGVRNLYLAPLMYNDEMIGILEVGSPHPGDVNEINSMILNDVLPLFAMCVKRGVEELNNKIQAVIKEKCTAVYPAVEWRFRQAALNYIDGENNGGHPEMEEIVFNDVYPVYSLSDIRESSSIRNSVIKEDLKDQLMLAKEVIQTAADHRTLPILNQLIFRIDKRINALDEGLQSGDETSILKFLQSEVEPLFPNFENFGGSVRDSIGKYRSSIDPEHGFYYKRRKEYEVSVNMVNETISDYLDEEEKKAQSMFPHYFEKYKTDGVEYMIYIGQELVDNKKFDILYLKNLRLWQFITTCGIVYRSNLLKKKMPVQLDTAHLILVQNRPLSIRFHNDQKKFDVDGTYNVHYEIMKKRIDKAEIKGTKERLTQPGKIAIVYTQSSEAAEYRQYIDYMQSNGYLTKEVEDYELEDLQGVQGLRALRVTVNNRSELLNGSPAQEEISRIIRSFRQPLTVN